MAVVRLTKPNSPEILGPVPGPRARAIVERDQAALSPSFTRPYPLVVESASGVWVTDVDGNRFLDLTAGIAVTATGHAHPEVVQAVAEQAARFLHMSGTDFYYEGQVELAERLLKVAPVARPGRVFFTNSGAEAIEGALKLARWTTGRPNLLAFTGAFHGRTMGALSLTASKARQREGFGPFLPGVHHVPFPRGSSQPTFDAIAELFASAAAPATFAAVFVEPIQGEGGIVVPPDDFLPRLRALTRQHGILLAVDEVQAGIGRTGTMFAVEGWGVEPDVIATAKGLASGLPLGAVIAGGRLMDWPPGAHGSTFAGNPVACAAALATLDVVEPLLGHVRAIGEALLESLTGIAARHPGLVLEARGRGLMTAIETPSHEAADAVIEAAFERGLLLLPAGRRAIRLTPALTISADELETGLAILDAALAAVEASGAAPPA